MLVLRAGVALRKQFDTVTLELGVMVAGRHTPQYVVVEREARPVSYSNGHERGTSIRNVWGNVTNPERATDF